MRRFLLVNRFTNGLSGRSSFARIRWSEALFDGFCRLGRACYIPRVMRSHARTIHVLLCALIVALSVASPALAQDVTDGATPTTAGSPSPEFTKPGAAPAPPGGICAPWHRCAAWAGLGMAVLFGLAIAAGYMIQSKGFEQLEHKQGTPEGVKASRE